MGILAGSVGDIARLRKKHPGRDGDDGNNCKKSGQCKILCCINNCSPFHFLIRYFPFYCLSSGANQSMRFAAPVQISWAVAPLLAVPGET